MKLKRIMIPFAIVFMAVICTVTVSHSEVCFNAEITRIGSLAPVSPSSGSRIEVQGGSCNLPVNFPLFIHEDLGNQGLATVLTAMSLGKTITFRVPNPNTVSPNDLIIAVHVDSN